LVVRAVAIAGACAVGLAVADLARTGFIRPAVFVVGALVTFALNRVYVVIVRRGGVLEGIDIAELPIVALALLVPSGEAMLAFLAGSVLVELTVERALVKKVFNVGLRATSAGALLLIAHAITPFQLQVEARGYVAVGVGAAAYTLLNSAAIAAVVSSIEREPVLSVMRNGAVARLGIAAVSITMGLTAAQLEQHAPLALIGLAVPLVLVATATAAARHAQRDRDRLQHVLDATTQIQSVPEPEAQDAALLAAARDLLLWRHVEVRDTAPTDDEVGRRLYERDGRERWLVARPAPDSDPWTAADTTVLETLANAASAALERSRLQEELSRLSRLDPLTGLANRRRLDDELAALLDPRAPQAFAVLLLDLDGFKAINDDLGHHVGDELLQTVAARLARCVRRGDLVARLGGDEFLVVLPRVDASWVVRSIVQTIRAAVAEPVQIDGWRLAVSVSIGVAHSPDDGLTITDVIRAADRRMYRSKAGHGQRSVLVGVPTQRERVATPDAPA
jgi:diguanylate cyclase (GGDEF)-like protein